MIFEEENINPDSHKLKTDLNINNYFGDGLGSGQGLYFGKGYGTGFSWSDGYGDDNGIGWGDGESLIRISGHGSENGMGGDLTI